MGLKDLSPGERAKKYRKYRAAASERKRDPGYKPREKLVYATEEERKQGRLSKRRKRGRERRKKRAEAEGREFVPKPRHDSPESRKKARKNNIKKYNAKPSTSAAKEQWAKENPDKTAQATADWRKNNPVTFGAINRKNALKYYYKTGKKKKEAKFEEEFSSICYKDGKPGTYADTMDELFTEWYFAKASKGESLDGFLVSQALDIVMSSKDLYNLLEGNAIIPVKFIPALKKAIPFEISAKKIAEINNDSWVQNRKAYIIEMEDEKIQEFTKAVKKMKRAAIKAHKDSFRFQKAGEKQAGFGIHAMDGR